jgi:hypothetical protein
MVGGGAELLTPPTSFISVLVPTAMRPFHAVVAPRQTHVRGGGKDLASPTTLWDVTSCASVLCS